MRRSVSPKTVMIMLSLCTCLSFAWSFQQTPDYGKILGKWKIEVNVDGEYYHLTLNLRSVNGTLEGTISESMGYFTDVSVSNIAFAGETFSFEFNSPTPPDGMQRLVSAEFKVGVDVMDGVVSVIELGVSASATATREKL